MGDTYAIEAFPRQRQLVRDAGWMGRRKSMIHGFVEIDVTAARQRMRQYQEKLSFTAFLLAAIGRAVEADKRVHGCLDWRSRLIVFDEVDALITIEIPTEDGTFPLVQPIRGINLRPVADIHREIRAVQKNPRQSAGMQSPLMRTFYYYPGFLRHIAYRILERKPHWRKDFAGTVGFTSVGMFGKGSGWGLGMPIHTLAITAGGIAEKPAVVAGSIKIREFLSVTLSFDHDVVDGAPAARFTQRFIDLVEQVDLLPAPEQEPAGGWSTLSHLPE